MVACSLFLGAFGWRLQRARKQAQTVGALRGLGCNVQYDYVFERTQDGGFTRAQKSGTSIPTIFIKWLGEDFFHDVHAVNANRVQPKSPQDVQKFWKQVAMLPAMHHFQLEGDWLDHDGFAALRGNLALQHVRLSSKNVTDADLAVAGTMPNLREFHLTGFDMVVTDEGIAALDGLGELQSFSLFFTGITDEAARHLAKHPKLMAMQLSGTHFTDESIRWLGQLTELRQLSIDGTIGDDGLRNLKTLTKLELLSLRSAKITDQGLAHLSGLTELQVLGLQGTKVHGPGLAHLRNLQKLESLSLLDNPITDEDLQYFALLPLLSTLPLGGSQVTDEGILNFKIPGNVTEIHLVSTKITDKTLRTLAGQKQLTFLWVGNTQVTPEGVAQFQASLPTCRVAQ